VGDATPTTGKGRRLIMFHAFTKFGFVGPSPSDAGVYARTTACEWGKIQLDQQQDSAAWVFPADSRFKDYHKNVDGWMFMKWVENCLIPSFKKYFPGKKMILVLDNAPYHHGYGEDSYIPRTQNKSENIAYLEKLEVQTIEYVRSGVTKTAGSAAWVAGGNPDEPSRTSWSAKAPKGPSEEDVMLATTAYLEANYPERLQTALQVLFKREGYVLLFCAPYCPKFQPIERVWGWTKNMVANLWYSGRTLKETFAQLMGVWFGGVIPKDKGEAKARGFTAKLAQSFILQSEKDMDQWIKEHGVRISGKVRGPQALFLYDESLSYEDDGGEGEETVDAEEDDINLGD
jgi:hypothetical protein